MKKSWLHDKIMPILKAKRHGYFDYFGISELIQEIADDLLFELWIEWLDKDEGKWESKSKVSFVIWLRGEVNNNEPTRD